MLYLKHIGLTRLGTDSGAADFLRSARPAEAAIAKVFAKIRRKILILQIFRTRRTLGDVENYLLSKFQPSTTLGGTKNVKKTKKKSDLFTVSEFSFS